MLLWLKFFSFVFFGMWGIFSGVQYRRKGNRSSLGKFFSRLENFLFILGLVVLVGAFGFYLGSASPSGVSFLTVPALAYVGGSILAYAVTDINAAKH